MTLADAITATEQAQTAYNAAVTTTTNDQATADSIKSKLDAASAQVVQDQQSQQQQASALNTSLDALIAAATAAKIPGA